MTNNQPSLTPRHETTDDQMWLFKSHTEPADIEAVTEVLERGTWWAGGPEIDEFERMIAEMSDCKYGVTFNSGTSALFAAFEVLDVEGNEVIVPSFTYPATANAVVAAGGEPVFADIERETLSLDADDVLEKVTDDTAAVVPVHFSGNVSRDIHALQDVAEDHDLELVEDAAHSLGAAYDGDPVGSFGAAATYSFSFNKLLTTGEGGMLVTDSESIRDKAKRIRRQGRNDRKQYVDYGYNLQMSSIEAALGVSQARRFEEIAAQRREMATYLNRNLSDIDQLSVPALPDDRKRVYLFYNLRLSGPDLRDRLREHLDDRGIPTQVTYEPVHLTEYYRTEWEPGDLPVTESVSERILTLPFHLELSQDDLDTLVGAVRDFFR